MSLSVIVIAKNEEAVIDRCLSSVSWADQIVVVDSGSSDNTLAICRKHNVKLETTTDWPGYGTQKNRALRLAECDWVLSLDADEWIDDKLRLEIQHILENPDGNAGFAIPRRSNYCGKWMRHSGWWPDHVVRLFLRGSGKFSDDLVHEKVLLSGKLGALKNAILHEAIPNLEDALDKMNRYSSAGAQKMKENGRQGSLVGAIWHGFWTFFKTYFIRAGFLDGKYGFMLAVSNAEGAYYRYLKLMLLSRIEN